MSFIEADQYCSPKNVTKAMLHITH